MKRSFYLIAIDGGAGTGKSTTASILSERLNFLHVDTGSHYRSITRHLLNLGVGPEEAEKYININKLILSSEIEERKSKLSLDGKSFGKDQLRSKEVNDMVSKFACLPALRNTLFNYQREQVDLAQSHNFVGLVMEGRDIGTVIFPNADLKVFLHADPSVRENRRKRDGESDEIASRDRQDKQRQVAPLKESSGSLRIDTSALGIEEVYETIVTHLKR
jgi:cytidylate kinase|tara:strand:+ start:5004 stop:5657 length:654 start_codon:yes stop_codon:yes gene_type:complete